MTYHVLLRRLLKLMLLLLLCLLLLLLRLLLLLHVLLLLQMLLLLQLTQLVLLLHLRVHAHYLVLLRTVARRRELHLEHLHDTLCLYHDYLQILDRDDISRACRRGQHPPLRRHQAYLQG